MVILNKSDYIEMMESTLRKMEEEIKDKDPNKEI